MRIRAHVHACMFTGVGVHACHDTWVEVRENSQGSVLAFCLVFWDQVSRLPLYTPGYLTHVFSGILLSSPPSCLRSTEITGLYYMSDLTWVLRSRTQILKPAWHVLYPPSHLPSLRTFFFFFLNNIVLGFVPLCRFHCTPPSSGSLTNASFPYYLSPGNAVNNFRVPEPWVLGPSINTRLHGHVGPCTNGLTLAHSSCTSSCTLSVSFALLRTTNTSQVCVNSC